MFDESVRKTQEVNVSYLVVDDAIEVLDNTWNIKEIKRKTDKIELTAQRLIIWEGKVVKNTINLEFRDTDSVNQVSYSKK